MVRVHYCPIKIMTIILIILSFILYIYINLFIFNMQREFFLKILYISFCCLSLNLLFYINIEYFLLYFSKALNQYLIVKDFQDIINIYVQISLLLTVFFLIFYILGLGLLWQQSLVYKSNNIFYLIFLLSYGFVVSCWIVKQDLFYSNWEIFLNTSKNLIFDLQPDFYLFFNSLIEDISDFFSFLLLIYFGYFWMYTKLPLSNITISNWRKLIFFFLVSYCLYFFSCETLWNLASYLGICFCIQEGLLLTWCFLIELKKIILKLKYL